MDGKVDYSSYTDRELDQASASIDAASYPLNFANLRRERERREVASRHASPGLQAAGRELVWREQTSEAAAAHRALSLGKYVTLFALTYYAGVLGLGVLYSQFQPERSSSLGGWFILLAALVVGRRFVAQQRRLFYANEARRLILYCLLVVVAMDAVAVSLRPELWDRPFELWVGIVLLIQLALDALLVWIAFRFVARRDMLRRLKVLGLDAA